MKNIVTFLTRYYPPTPNINGEAVCDMVHYLQEKAHIGCNVICMNRQFEGGGQRRVPAGHVIRLSTISESKQVWLRFITFLYDGIALICKGRQFKNTTLVVTTSPPMLPFWAALLWGKKIRWVLWAFDLFPEGFAATRLISENNIIYRWIVKKTYSAQPAMIIALGPMQALHLQRQFQRPIPTLILPCGVFFYQEKSVDPPPWFDAQKIILGYCGNVGDPHNPEFIKAAIDAITPEKHLLVLALYGNKSDELKAYARGKKGVLIVDHVPRSQLHFINIHLVSLRKEWTHIAVPSKAVSAISMGKTILFCGSLNSDNWQLLQEAGWFIEEDDRIRESVIRFLNSLSRDNLQEKEKKAALLHEQLKHMVMNTYEKMADMLQQNESREF